MFTKWTNVTLHEVLERVSVRQGAEDDTCIKNEACVGVEVGGESDKGGRK